MKQTMWRSLLIVMLCLPAAAQWSTGSGGTIYYNGGNVGIGTSSPFQSLHVNGNVEVDGVYPLVIGTTGFAYFPANTSHIAYYREHGQYEFYWRASDNGQPNGPNETTLMSLNDSRLFVAGNVGIGTTTPSSSLQIGNTTSYMQDARITMAVASGAGNFRSWSIGTQYGGTAFSSPNYGFTIRDESAGVDRMVIDWSTGNVGIGTASPQYPLSVNGTIQAKEVIVNTGWSDYVFDSGYKLIPLPEVASYIKQHHHLPGVPSEAQIKQKGVSVGQMESTLLAKVEELTLNIIQMQRDDTELRQQNKQLLQRVARLEAQVQSRNDGKPAVAAR